MIYGGNSNKAYTNIPKNHGGIKVYIKYKKGFVYKEPAPVVKKPAVVPAPVVKKPVPIIKKPKWVLVRSIPAQNKWFKATDQLRGIDQYREPSGEFSNRYDINLVDEFKFESGDKKHFLIASKDALLVQNLMQIIPEL